MSPLPASCLQPLSELNFSLLLPHSYQFLHTVRIASGTDRTRDFTPVKGVRLVVPATVPPALKCARMLREGAALAVRGFPGVVAGMVRENGLLKAG
jgi:hypothetical protein